MDKLFQPLLELSPFTIYLLIGLLCWSEGAFFLGFVTPGELAVVAGGILASRGHLEMDVLLGVVVSATIAGNATGFYVGSSLGHRNAGMGAASAILRPFDPENAGLHVSPGGMGHCAEPGIRPPPESSYRFSQAPPGFRIVVSCCSMCRRAWSGPSCMPRLGTYSAPPGTSSER